MVAERILTVYDVSYLISAGSLSKYKMDTILGVPVGGIRHLMDKVFLHLSQGKSVALAFDARSDKKVKFPDYKAGRVPHHEIWCQCDMARDWSCRMHLPVFYKDGYEADELIYSIVKNNYELFNRVDVYTGDADIAGCMYDQRVRLIGTTTQTPTITVENYPFDLISGAFVQYNSILPYLVLHGKKANNLKPLKLSGGWDPKIVYNDYIKYCEAQGVSEGDRGDRKIFLIWWLTKKFHLPEEDRKSFEDRVELVYPRLLSENETHVSFGPRQEIDRECMIEFMRLIGLKNSAINMGVREEVFSAVDLTPSEKKYLYDIASSLQSGVYAADRDLPLGDDIFAETFAAENETTMFFSEEEI